MNAHNIQTAAARLLIIITLACLVLVSCSACAVSMAGAQATTNMSNMNGSMSSSVKEEEPKSIVYGRAIYDDTGRPVRRARVMLLNVDGPERSGLTNASGEFRIKNVPAGNYFTAVDAPGVVSPVSLLDARTLRANKVDLAPVRAQFDEIEVDGKTDREITVRARRGAAIGGRVTYADGDPAINVPVAVMHRQEDSKVLTQTIVGLSTETMSGMKTDDRGMFRIAGLPPGEYLVAVSEVIEHGEDNGGRYGGMDSFLMGDALTITFYPSATRAKSATPVRLEAGEERGGVDITITGRALHTLSGVVRGGREGRPVANASVSFMLNEMDAGGDGNSISLLSDKSPGTTQTDERGLWQLNELPDGIYTISVSPPRNYSAGAMDEGVTETTSGTGAPARPKMSYASKQQDVKIAGSDVTDVAIVLAVGGRISGTYTREGKRRQAGSYDYANFYIETSDAKILGTGGGAGGNFTIDGVQAGKAFLRDGSYRSQGDGEYVKSMSWRGRDLLREPLDIAEETEIEGVKVVFASDVATLSLHALAASDKRALRGALMLLVPADPTQWSRFDERQASCTSDRDGVCSISRAPGEYLVFALAPGARQGNLETVIRERSAGAKRVTLRAGEHSSLEVVVNDGK